MSGLSLRSDPRWSLGFEVLDAIGRAVVSGSLDGHRLPIEQAIADQLRVSRGIVREALKMLGAKGLVGARPRRGTDVRPFANWNLFDQDVVRWITETRLSPQLLRHFSELRLAVEPTAASLAATRAHEDAVRTIAASFRRMEAAEEGRDNALEADIAFHTSILQASRNPFLVKLESLIRAAMTASARSRDRPPSRAAPLGQHRNVLEAIATRNPIAAASAMSALIGETGATARIGTADLSSHLN